MAVAHLKEIPSKPTQVSDEEWQARLDLAACYRLSRISAGRI